MTNPLGIFLHGLDDPFKTYGTEDLCTWCDPGERGVSFIQTRCPRFARKLSQRSKAGLIRWSVYGGYLRIFAERIEPWRARKLVERYLKATNGASERSGSRPTRRNRPAGWLVRPNR